MLLVCPMPGLARAIRYARSGGRRGEGNGRAGLALYGRNGSQRSTDPVYVRQETRAILSHRVQKAVPWLSRPMTADRIRPGVRGTIAQRQVITIDHERLFRPAVLVI